MRRAAVALMIGFFLGGGGIAHAEEAQLRDAMLKRERSPGGVPVYELVVRTKGTISRDKVWVGLLSDRRLVRAEPDGPSYRRWVVNGSTRRSRHVLNGLRRIIESESREYAGVALDDHDPLPDPVHGFRLRAYNERAVITG
jgi:hypothetical protein